MGVLSAHPPSTCPQCSEQAFVTFPGLKFPSIKQESWTFFFSPAVKSFFTHGSLHASASKDTEGRGSGRGQDYTSPRPCSGTVG